MGIHEMNVLHYHASLVVDGVAYQVSVRVSSGPMAAESVPVHNHSQFELLAFFDGATVIQADDRPRIQLQGGQCCLLRPDVYHMRPAAPDATKFYTMFIQGPKNTPLDAVKEPCILLHCAPELLEWFGVLERELCGQSLGADSNLRSLANLILVSVLRELADQREKPAARQRNCGARYEDVIDDYFSLRYAEDLSVGELAEQMGITPRHLTRIMQQSYGCTFRQRLLAIRLYHAQRFLAYTQLPIAQVAMRCGFTAERAFSAAFRKHIGCTPSQYRRNKRIEQP